MHKIMRHVLLILVPVVAAFAILPGIYSNHLLLFNFMIFIMLAQGVNVIYGFTGYLPFGYVGFFGAGAYGFSLMVIHLQAPPLLALPVGAGAAVALGLILTPLFRLSGAYFSIANLAAALAVLQVVSNPNLESITKGPYGISLSGVFNPTLAYGTTLAVLAATLGLVILSAQFPLWHGTPGHPRGSDQRQHGRHQRGARAHNRVALERAHRWPGRRRLRLVRIGILSRDGLQLASSRSSRSCSPFLAATRRSLDRSLASSFSMASTIQSGFRHLSIFSSSTAH